jgi:hypothetical protein
LEPADEGIAGNEMTDRLAKLGYEQPFIEPESLVASQWEFPRKQIRTRQKEITGKAGITQVDLTGKGTQQGPSVNKTKELLTVKETSYNRW